MPTAQPLILVTRPEPQAGQWVTQLRDLGLQAGALPLLAIGPAPDPALLQATFQALRPGTLLMFVSPNAALRFFDALPTGARWPDGVLAAATGPGTVAALRAAGLVEGRIVAPAADSAQFDSEALWADLKAQDWRGRQVWVVRGEGGRDWLARTLAEAGAEVQFLQSYSRIAPDWTDTQRALLERAAARPDSVRWLLSSSEALDALRLSACGADWAASTAWATHPRIAGHARRFGFGRVVELRPTLDAVAAALGAERS